VAIVLPNGRNYFATSTGVPAVGYKVYAFVAGTSTPKDTYTTSAASVANAHPVVLDSRGEAAIYWNGTYDVVLKDAAGSVIWGPERLYAPDLADWLTRADLASTASVGLGDALVGVNRTALGAIATTEHAWHEKQVIDAKADFGAVGDGTTNDTAAIVAANTAALAASLPLRIPAGTYKFVPTVVTEIGNWFGDGPNATLIKCDCTSYSGVVFRKPGSTEIRDICIYEDGLSKLGTGLQLSATNTDSFTGHQRLKRVLIQGFNKNLDVNNTFMVTADQCRFESGAEGLWCDPADNVGDNGYVTTHLWLNCWFASNTRNVYYSPALTSKCVTLVGGAIESATGSAESSYWQNMRTLSMKGVYFESGSTIPAVRLDSSSQVDLQGCYFNGTGGIAMNANCEFTLRNSQMVTSTDIITGTASTNLITIENCALYSSGNILSAGSLTIRNSSVNGTTYADYSRNWAVGFQADTYGATITPTLRDGVFVRYVVNNGAAFTVAAPVTGSTSVSLVPGTHLTLNLKNTSGGAMGAITWNAVFKVPAITAPATGNQRSYHFCYDNTNWIFLWQSAADVPN
jgi:hypothetical protein